MNRFLRSYLSSGVFAAAVAASFFSLASQAYASPPKEFIQCTSAPKSTWVSEARIRQVFDESKYAKVFLKLSRGNCYEFYAIAKDNSIVEAYYDPVTSNLIRHTRIAPDGDTKTSVQPKPAQ